MLEGYLVQSCEKLTTTFSRRGDRVYANSTTLSCRFREIDTISRTTHREQNESDAMIWLSPTAPVSKGDIIRFDGTYYQIERINKARRLGESTAQFVKCDLKITQIDIS